MREQYVRILVPNYNPDPLSVKQFFQMQSFAKDVQTVSIRRNAPFTL